ncbi:MAG: glycoside hydrolase family 97 N-terminal domain-containing protein, partial [Tannerella sp.]|nr:glycoside hydrolase family 97 N-terminal domain-containing protein [Tannerella sp.]
MKRILFCILAVCVYTPVFSTEVNISSPDGDFQMKVYDRSDRIYYSVSYAGQPVVLESLLGINGNGEWKEGVRVDKSLAASVDTLWKPVYGERSIVRDHYNWYEIDIVQPD